AIEEVPDDSTRCAIEIHRPICRAVTHERLNSSVAGIPFEPQQCAEWLLTCRIEGGVVPRIDAGENTVTRRGEGGAYTGNRRARHAARNNAARISAVDRSGAVVNCRRVSGGVGSDETWGIHPIIKKRTIIKHGLLIVSGNCACGIVSTDLAAAEDIGIDSDFI